MAKKKITKKPLDPRAIQVAKRLEMLRKEKGYTSYENFAIDKGLPRMQYWRMEKGTNFTFESLLRILDAHEMSLAQFFHEFN